MKRIAFLLLLVLLSYYKSESQQLMVKTIKHAFSDPRKQDMFKLSLAGTSVLKAKVTFTIVDFTGKEIFNEAFPAEDLLYDEADVLTPAQQVDTIKKRFIQFFSYPGFKTPAIKATEKNDYDIEDKNNWTDIKSDRSAIGFIYAHGYESHYGIAWSKKRKKVVQYYYSD